VDDILVSGIGVEKDIQGLGYSLKRQRELKLGESAVYLGMHIARVQDGFTIKPELDKLPEPVWTASATTPLPLTMTPDESPPLPQHLVTPFRSQLGSISWLANTTRPDIEYACSFLRHYQQTPTEKALQLLQRLIAYTRTHDLGIKIYTINPNHPIHLIAHTDASWAAKHDGYMSVSGIVVSLVQGTKHTPLQWKCTGRDTGS